MNFEDYINQKDAQKQPCFSVKVFKYHLAAIWPVEDGCNVQINMFGDHFTYRCYSGQDGPLYTLDNKPTVFYLK
jgi:hypothetical protein